MTFLNFIFTSHFPLADGLHEQDRMPMSISHIGNFSKLKDCLGVMWGTVLLPQVMDEPQHPQLDNNQCQLHTRELNWVREWEQERQRRVGVETVMYPTLIITGHLDIKLLNLSFDLRRLSAAITFFVLNRYYVTIRILMTIT